MQNSFGMNIASATIAFVGTAFLSVHLALNAQALKSCQSSQSPDLCIYLGSSSDVCFKAANSVFQTIQKIEKNSMLYRMLTLLFTSFVLKGTLDNLSIF